MQTLTKAVHSIRSVCPVILTVNFFYSLHGVPTATVKLFLSGRDPNDGQRIYQKLIQDFRSPKSPAEVVLVLTALVSLTRLYADEYGVHASSSEESHVLTSLALLGKFPTGNRRATLEHLVWSLWTTASPWVAVTEGHKIWRILTHAVDEPEHTAKSTDNDMALYWPRGHEEVFSSLLS